MSTKTARAAMQLFAALFFCSCQPEKQLQKQDQAIQQLKAQWIAEWVKDHPCPPGPVINLDSLCRAVYGSPAIDTAAFSDEFDLAGPGSAGDSTERNHSGRDTAVQADSTLVRGRIPCAPVHLLVPYEDTRTINLLKDSLVAKSKQLTALQAGTSVQSQDCSTAIAAAQQSAKKWIWWLVASGILNLLFIILWVRSFITNSTKTT